MTIKPAQPGVTQLIIPMLIATQFASLTFDDSFDTSIAELPDDLDLNNSFDEDSTAALASQFVSEDQDLGSEEPEQGSDAGCEYLRLDDDGDLEVSEDDEEDLPANVTESDNKFQGPGSSESSDDDEAVASTHTPTVSIALLNLSGKTSQRGSASRISIAAIGAP